MYESAIYTVSGETEVWHGEGLRHRVVVTAAVSLYVPSELQSATYEPGDVIIRDGEPGERFYIIAEGRARAAKDGMQLREMGSGESFGEIALLRRIPRTATVTALSRLEARTLAHEEFLAAVTGNPESVERAEEVVPLPGSRPTDQACLPQHTSGRRRGHTATCRFPRSPFREQADRQMSSMRLAVMPEPAQAPVARRLKRKAGSSN